MRSQQASDREGPRLQQDELLERLVREVDADRLMGHLGEFARWTKEAGTPGERSSIAYVEAQMSALGYDTELLLHDAYISLPRGAWIEAGGRRFECITHSFSRSSPEGGVRARAVVLGAGGAEDFRAADVGGAIAIVDGIATAPVAVRSTQAGAIGQIHVCPAEQIHEMCISPVWGNPSHETLGELPDTVVVSVRKAVGDELKALCAGDPGLEFTLHAEVDTRWTKTPILVADMRAPGAAAGNAPFVLFSGHHDTWHLGVMDNGGANATMIEVGRLCAMHRDAWRRGLRIVFWSGHSQGRYSSSAWYADAHYEELRERAAAHVNIDSTGAKGNVVLCDAQADPELGSLAAEAISARGSQEFGGHIVARAGDQSFWGIGVPSIFAALGEQPASEAPIAASMLFGGPGRKGAGTGWWWHTPDDTLDKMDGDIAVRDTQIYLHVVWSLITREVLPIRHSAHLDALIGRLDQAAAKLGDRLQLDALVTRAGDLRSSLAQLERVAQGAAGPAADAVNACIMNVSHALVPIQHTIGDRFSHDPAFGLPPHAALRDLDVLAAAAPGSDHEKFVAVAAQRALNRVAAALREAQRHVDACLERIAYEASRTTTAEGTRDRG